MTIAQLPTKPTSADPETGVLARETAHHYGEMLAYYKRSYKLSHEQALDKMRDDNPAYLESILTRPPELLSWLDLDHLADRSPEKALELWEQVKEAAREELRSGHRMVRAVSVRGDYCWPRAQFLALREELLEGWKPTNGLERQLVETLAQAQAAYLQWMESLTTYTSLRCEEERSGRNDDGTWRPERISTAEAIDQAAAMVDRFHRLMMRTLRTLRDLRRYAPKVVVQNAEQVNVGEQQVNVTKG
jgi:hypothetical protein